MVTGHVSLIPVVHDDGLLGSACDAVMVLEEGKAASCLYQAGIERVHLGYGARNSQGVEDVSGSGQERGGEGEGEGEGRGRGREGGTKGREGKGRGREREGRVIVKVRDDGHTNKDGQALPLKCNDTALCGAALAPPQVGFKDSVKVLPKRSRSVVATPVVVLSGRGGEGREGEGEGKGGEGRG